MFNWYSEYLLIRARQREVNRAAENRLRLAASRDSAHPRRKQHGQRRGLASGVARGGSLEQLGAGMRLRGQAMQGPNQQA